MPKDQIARLLKKVMLMPNQKENLIDRFQQCGITPLDITPVLEQLPSEPSESLNSSILQAFTQQLIQLR